MSTKRVTVTLDEEKLNRIRAFVEVGSTPSVSEFIRRAAAVALDDLAGWGALLTESLDETGGPLTDEERAWADGILSGSAQRVSPGL